MGGNFEAGAVVGYLMGVHLAIVQACTAGPLQLSQHAARVSIISDNHGIRCRNELLCAQAKTRKVTLEAIG